MLPSLAVLACGGQPGPPLQTPPAPSEASHVSLAYDALVTAVEGLELHQLGWEVDGRTGVAWAARVPRAGALAVLPSDEVASLTTLVGNEVGTWAAINGGFYEDGPMGLVVSAGVERHALTDRGGSGVVSYGPTPVAVFHRDAWLPGAQEALQSIDRVVDGGVALVKSRAGAHRDARSAVAVSADAVWVVAAVAADSVRASPDGVQLINTVGEGLTLAEFADFLVSTLHADQALNLDGAVSTQMVVSTPTWRWVLRGERGTINGVLVRP